MKRFIGILTSLILLAVLLTVPAFAETGTQAAASAPVYSADDLFTDRDLEQTADLTEAVRYTLSDGQDITIDAAGVYVITGTAENATVIVEAGTDDKVQIVLEGVNITNKSLPAVYVKSAGKVFITVAGDSSLSVTGTFRADGSTNTDGVIFSKEDLTLNGTAVLTLSSTKNGIVGKDDVKITGGTYRITASSKAVEANDSIRIAAGTLNLTAGTDGLHAENTEDPEKGYVYIGGGTLTVDAGDDGIHGTSVVQIDGGDMTVRAAEGIEGTYVQINGGTISIQSSDDGINAARKSSAYTPLIEINDGDITIVMGAGDTDGIDANGQVIVNGGTVRVTGNSTFDYDGTAQYNGGTIIVNGQQVSSIPNQMMGGGRGGWGGQNNGFGGQDGGWGGQSGGQNGGRNGGGRGGRGGW